MKYFSIEELTRSTTATARGIDNTPDAAARAALVRLADAVLDPLREAYGKPVKVNSGYRCPKLNRAVGGVATSHHLRGMAADITGGSPEENRRLFDLARSLQLPFTQLIDERGFRWLHISHDPADIRRQVLHR
ncbi:MAG: peptidase M15 [Muribaculaceae bacterium]|nr:peptidase M15 [Muribaculaceae bacterium]